MNATGPGDSQDVTTSFMFRTLRRLQALGVVRPEDDFLVVFAGRFDRAVFEALGFRRCIFTDIDPRHPEIVTVDARRLPHPDRSVDHVVCHAGLHHTSRPHQAVCEMYRVARRTVVFFESQDSWPMRLACRLRLAGTYEFNATLLHEGRGGTDGTSIPNYVYRWTRREVEKLVRAVDPAVEPNLMFWTEWGLQTHLERVVQRTFLRRIPRPVRRVAIERPLERLLHWTGAFGNRFAVCIRKGDARPHPWVHMEGDAVRIDVEQARRSRAARGLTAAEHPAFEN